MSYTDWLERNSAVGTTPRRVYNSLSRTTIASLIKFSLLKNEYWVDSLFSCQAVSRCFNSSIDVMVIKHEHFFLLFFPSRTPLSPTKRLNVLRRISILYVTPDLVLLTLIEVCLQWKGDKCTSSFGTFSYLPLATPLSFPPPIVRNK